MRDLRLLPESKVEASLSVQQHFFVCHVVPWHACTTLRLFRARCKISAAVYPSTSVRDAPSHPLCAPPVPQRAT